MQILIQFDRKDLYFTSPIQIISTHNHDQIKSCLDMIDSCLSNGFYAAGFLSYESGYSFEESLNFKNRTEFPLLYFGIYEKPVFRAKPVFCRKKSFKIKNLRINTSLKKYFSDIETIRDHIASGDVYQITYCIKNLFDFDGDRFSLYSSLFREQPVPYNAYIDTGRFQILSLSPEKFLKKTGANIETKPMKGTWPRGKSPIHDIFHRFKFQYDAKNRAENVMIADLMRNDLGRIAHNIHVPKLFDITGYRTLFQMTSTVKGTINCPLSLYEIFANLFPSGSVTGAPKIKAMQIIRDLEPDDRKIYTGAIGYITPHKDLYFNIPIRTILLQNGKGELGIGGGIVWDSTPLGEWEEGMLKSKFLTDMINTHQNSPSKQYQHFRVKKE
ncbi:MAG TPA: chorismate-binding protein [Candidatus Omnitrophota bacterium]|nr:chorismate-binding protein [Candidatus Omnitrophota bacterium]HPS19394.1 chorismate-binding protein [Candidatus Omnitrophota bacterium]